MIRFSIPGEAPKEQPKPEVKEPSPKKVKTKEFDPEVHLNRSEDLDEWADILWDKKDWDNYNLVANFSNKMVGWKRHQIVGEPSRMIRFKLP